MNLRRDLMGRRIRISLSRSSLLTIVSIDKENRVELVLVPSAQSMAIRYRLIEIQIARQGSLHAENPTTGSRWSKLVWLNGPGRKPYLVE
ncbi:unnamed protein product [Dovyalis caffra]|uniref:Uncharacterized protein n=1 Tax=Dovyalis caffra TaxID=77055 RepID=A0AAV1SU02_9ROSI|nr:unnamed protein product [Dovyalis caffra]